MKIKYIPQNEASECGLACLAMIFSGYGLHTDLRYLRNKFPISSRGMSALDVVNVAKSSGFDFKASRYTLDQISSISKPVILHWTHDHFVVLERVSRKGYRIFNPATGILYLQKIDMNRGFTGIAIELEPNDQFVPENHIQRVKFRDICNTIYRYRAMAWVLIALSFLIDLSAIAIPLTQQIIIDSMFDSSLSIELVIFAIAGIALTRVICIQLRAVVTRHLIYAATIDFANRLFKHLIKLPISYFINRYPVDIYYRAKSVFHISSSLSTGLTDIVLGLLLSIVVLIVMFKYSVVLTLIVLIAPILNIANRAYFNETLVDLLKSSLYRFSWSQATLIESVRGIASIKSVNKESLRTQRYTAQVSKYVRRQHEYLTLKTKVVLLSDIYEGTGYILVSYFGGTMVINGTLTVGQFIAFLGLSAHFFFNISRFIDRLFDLQMLNAHWNRILDIVQESTESNTNKIDQTQKLKELSIIQIEDVSFRWGMNQPDILKNLNLTVKKGCRTAIVGKSGAGKSTMIKILTGQLQATSGLVKFNDAYNIEDYKKFFRSKVAVLNQDDTLFSASLQDNITLFEASPDVEKVQNSLEFIKASNNTKFFSRGLEEYIDADNNNLSGGDKQRILLARAIYQEPDFLIMDESTTFLGEASEQDLFNQLFASDMGVIVVTHRQNFLHLFEQIYELSSSSLTLKE